MHLLIRLASIRCASLAKTAVDDVCRTGCDGLVVVCVSIGSTLARLKEGKSGSSGGSSVDADLGDENV